MPTIATISQRLGQPQHLDHQIGADVARPDDRHVRCCHDGPPCRRSGRRTEPRPEIRRLVRRARASPAPSDRARRRAPRRRRAADRPSRAIVCANHCNACSGLPRHAAPAPTETGSPACSSTMPHSAQVHVRRADAACVPSTNRPLEALSATVSTIEMSHPRDPASRRSRSPAARGRPRGSRRPVIRSSGRSAPSTNATSASTRGWSSRPIGTSAPSGTAMSSVSTPKSGWKTPKLSCTARDVSPIFAPTRRRPRCKPLPHLELLHRVRRRDVALRQQPPAQRRARLAGLLRVGQFPGRPRSLSVPCAARGRCVAHDRSTQTLVSSE